jgi:hypothetical protein
MGGGGDRFGCAEFGTHAAVEHAQSRLALLKRLSGHSESDGNSILDLSRPTPKDLPAADIVVRA